MEVSEKLSGSGTVEIGECGPDNVIGEVVVGTASRRAVVLRGNDFWDTTSR